MLLSAHTTIFSCQLVPRLWHNDTPLIPQNFCRAMTCTLPASWPWPSSSCQDAPHLLTTSTSTPTMSLWATLSAPPGMHCPYLRTDCVLPVRFRYPAVMISLLRYGGQGTLSVLWGRTPFFFCPDCHCKDVNVVRDKDWEAKSHCAYRLHFFVV